MRLAVMPFLFIALLILSSILASETDLEGNEDKTAITWNSCMRNITEDPQLKPLFLIYSNLLTFTTRIPLSRTTQYHIGGINLYGGEHILDEFVSRNKHLRRLLQMKLGKCLKELENEKKKSVNAQKQRIKAAGESEKEKLLVPFPENSSFDGQDLIKDVDPQVFSPFMTRKEGEADIRLISRAPVKEEHYAVLMLRIMTCTSLISRLEGQLKTIEEVVRETFFPLSTFQRHAMAWWCGGITIIGGLAISLTFLIWKRQKRLAKRQRQSQLETTQSQREEDVGDDENYFASLRLHQLPYV